MASQEKIAWAVFAGLALIAVVRASTAAAILDSPAGDDKARHAVFATIAAEEPKMRRTSAKDFPADPWSQDDNFHNLEYKKAKALGGEQGMSLADVLRATDDGMREVWPRPPGIWLNPSVPPCHPRPIH
jgi:hypothetical protein